MYVCLMHWLSYFKEGRRLARCIVKNNGSGLCVIILLNKTALWVTFLEKINSDSTKSSEGLGA